MPSLLHHAVFRVVLSNSTSFCSVLQGSVLGPHMFILYMADLADVVKNCQVNFHSFADDSQIYLHCPLSGVLSAVRKLED